MNSPSGYSWHARRPLGRDVDLDAITPGQWERVAAARLTYLTATSIKAVKARQLKRAQALRDRADAIEVWVAAQGEQEADHAGLCSDDGLPSLVPCAQLRARSGHSSYAQM